MSNIHKSITELIGRTPLLELENYERKHGLEAKIIAKPEYFNSNQSVKDRIALAMNDDAEKKGLLKLGYTIVETTSGNTGIGMAAIAAARGYSFRVYVQDNVSEERFKNIKAFGGETIRFSQVPEVQAVLDETGGDFVAAVRTLKKKVLSKEKTSFLSIRSKIWQILPFMKRPQGPRYGRIPVLGTCPRNFLKKHSESLEVKYGN